MGSAGFLEFRGAVPSGPQTSARAGGRWLGGWVCFGFNGCFATRRGVALCWGSLCLDSNVFSPFLPLLIWFLTAHCLLPVSSCLLFCLFASVLLRWLRCCSSVWQPSYFWGIPWVWRGASIRFSPSLYKPSGLDGRQSVRRGYCGCQRRRIRVSAQGGDPGTPQAQAEPLCGAGLTGAGWRFPG